MILAGFCVRRLQRRHDPQQGAQRLALIPGLGGDLADVSAGRAPARLAPLRDCTRLVSSPVAAPAAAPR